MPDPFRRLPNGGPLRGPIPRNPPGPRPVAPPPGGSAGAAQQTAAAQLGTVMFAPGFGRTASRPKRRAGRVARTSSRRKHRRSLGKVKRSRRAKFVKGSAAAKRHMAKLRRMQKRRR